MLTLEAKIPKPKDDEGGPSISSESTSDVPLPQTLVRIPANQEMLKNLG